MRVNIIKLILVVGTIIVTPLQSSYATNEAACKSSCSDYNAASDLLSSANSKCSQYPGCKKCAEATKNNTAKAPYCESVKHNKGVSSDQVKSAIPYGVAAIICGVACAGESGCVYCEWAAAVCPYLGMAAGMAENMMVKKSNDSLDGIITGLGSVVPMAAKALTQNSSNNNAACVSMGVFGAISIYKLVKAPKDIGNINEELCNSALALDSEINQIEGCIAQYKPLIPVISTTGAGGGDFDSIPKPEEISALTAGDGTAGNMLGVISSKFKDLPKDFSYDKLAKRISDGESASAILGDMKDLSKDVVGKLADIEKRVKDGEKSNLLNELSLGKVIAGTGSKKSGTSGYDSEIGFGMGDGVGTGVSGDEISIDRKPSQTSLASMDGDIFHTGYPGTIFQIISKKLVDNRDAVENLEPVLPLNRALSGFKNSTPIRK